MPAHSPNHHEPRPRWLPSRLTKIGVIGAGEVGLSTAIELAERGHHVVCADDSERVAAAAGLVQQAPANQWRGRLRFTCSSADAARHGDVIVIAVAAHGEDQLLDAVVEVAQNLTGPTVIVDKSTASPAVADRVARLMACNSSHEILVVSEPQSPRRGLRAFFRAPDVIA